MLYGRLLKEIILPAWWNLYFVYYITMNMKMNYLTKIVVHTNKIVLGDWKSVKC